MILYIDTSALIKAYVTEDASEDVLALMGEADVVATSRLAYPEATAALARRGREGHLAAPALARAMEALRAQRREFLTIELDEDSAVALVLRHPLRAADALHLAAALEVAATAGEAHLVFACYDRRLNEAAQAEGLAVFGSTLSPQGSGGLRHHSIRGGQHLNTGRSHDAEV